MWFVPKIPRKQKCRNCGMHALHRYKAECVREMREERDVLLRLLRARERLSGVVLLCPFCQSELVQTKVADTIMDGLCLRRVYSCPGCRKQVVTVEHVSVASAYVLAGLAAPPKTPRSRKEAPGIRALRLDTEEIKRLMRETEEGWSTRDADEDSGSQGQ